MKNKEQKISGFKSPEALAIAILNSIPKSTNAFALGLRAVIVRKT